MQCFICKKEIKSGQPFISIGKGLIRHKKCRPGQPKDLTKEPKMEEKEIVTPETPKVEETNVAETKKRGRGRPKGSKNKKKVTVDEQKA